MLIKHTYGDLHKPQSYYQSRVWLAKAAAATFGTLSNGVIAAMVAKIYSGKISALLDQNGNEAIVQEQESFDIDFSLTDLSDAVIDPNDLISATLTVYDEGNDSYVNDITDVNVLDTGRGTIVGTTLLKIRLDGADNSIVNSKLDSTQLESHIAELTYTYSDGVGNRTGKKVKRFYVQATASPT